MGKIKEALLSEMYEGPFNENFTVGERVIPYSHRKCTHCKSWFRYDEACLGIESAGYYKLVCPVCEKEYIYEREMHLPDDNLRFIEVD